MLNIKKWIFNPYQTCCYIVSDDSKECVIIDPCAYYDNERSCILDYIQDEGLKPVRCILTHAHFDHVLALDLIYDNYGLLPEVHRDDEPCMQRVKGRIIEIFGEKNYNREIPMPAHWLNDDDSIGFGTHQLSVIHTPGHSPGSVVYYCKEEQVAFTGDTLFCDFIGRTDLFGSDKEAYKKSLRKLMQLPDETVVQSGHTKKTTIGRERLKNSYLLELLRE